MGTATVTAAEGPRVRDTKLSIALRCGVCGAVLGVALLPPPPPFASLSFELRTLLKPLLAFVARKVPAGADVLHGWQRNHDHSHEMLADLWSQGAESLVRCSSCSSKEPSRYSRLLDA